MQKEKVELKKINEVYFRIICEKHIIAELASRLTFKVPGYQFHPKFKAHIWSGDICCLNRLNNTLYIGLIDHIKNFCNVYNYDLVYEQDVNEFDKETTIEFIRGLKLPFELRDYQVATFVHALKNNRALILSPTSSGKTATIYNLARYYSQDPAHRILLIVPTLNLIAQGKGDFKDYSVNNGFDVEKNVHLLYSGQDRSIDKQITISTWQTAAKLDKKYFEKFTCVIVDEAHLAKAMSIKKVLEACTNAKYRFGTTGTLDGAKAHEFVISGLTGPVYRATTTKKLMDQKHLADLSIKCIILKHKDEDCKRIKTFKYHEEIDFIISEARRNRFVKNLALSQKGNTLLLFQYVKKHGKVLYQEILNSIKKRGENRPVFFVAGETDMDDRETVRKLVENETNAIIVASFGTYSTGVNIKNIHSIIFASPSKSKIRVLQSLGRGLRTSETKKAVTLYDIVDDLHWKKHKNFSLQHFLERVNIYDSESLDYEIFQIDL